MATSSTPVPFEAQLDAQMLGRPADELTHAVLHAGGDDEVVRGVLLQHHPLHAHIIFGVAPVAQRIDVAHVETLLEPLGEILARPRVILRVTKVSPRRGDSWLKRMPLQAYMP